MVGRERPTMKRYIMFGGVYYDNNGGGLNDVVCSGDSIDECLKIVGNHRHEWVHFLDTSTGERVEVRDGREFREPV